MLFVQSLNNALHEMMAKDRQVILIGEDILDPYGGAFKVSKGLSTQFPKQVISTPISEQTITGAAIGMAMRGMKPVVEIMFGDFITLCTEQIVNQATKYQWMFNGQVTVPIVIRTPIGGGRGYGPTHSQTLESMFMSVPNLRIVAPSLFHNPGEMLKQCVFEFEQPVLFIEKKTDYPKLLITGDWFEELKIHRSRGEDGIEDILLSLYQDEKPDVVIVTYGGMAEMASKCAIEFFLENEVLINVLVLGSVRPILHSLIIEQARNCGRILVLEEGNKTGGWGAEVSSIVHENVFSYMHAPVLRVGASDNTIPSAMHLESQVLPSLGMLKKNVHQLIREI
jgi:pyruvate/2-oxoglutarate/acetoin dehydrogenase E1 component